MLTLLSSPRVGVKSDPCRTLGTSSSPSNIFSATKIGTKVSGILLTFSVVLFPFSNCSRSSFSNVACSVTKNEDENTPNSVSTIISYTPLASSVLTDGSGTFTYEYKIPLTDDSKGIYEIFVDTEFGVYSKTFSVTEQATLEKELKEQLAKGKRTTEKVNRIPDTFVPIFVAEKTLDGKELVPRVLQGSLLTPTRGEESNVNIKITTEDGTCIIGQESDCMVSDSTRAPGTIYQVVEIDGKNYNVRYSGPDARLEKFTILPESSIDTLPDSTWNVEVMKDEQPSRLYYKITYITLE